MSYSFSARGETKSDVMKAVAAGFDNVVASQPVHSADRAQAMAAVEAFLGIVPETAGKDFLVSVNGSLGWSGLLGSPEQAFTGAGVGVSVSLVQTAA